jgi:hypothetical protein
MAAAVLIIEEVIGLLRKTLLDGISHIFQFWERGIFYKFSHVRFTDLLAIPGAVLQTLSCRQKRTTETKLPRGIRPVTFLTRQTRREI